MTFVHSTLQNPPTPPIPPWSIVALTVIGLPIDQHVAGWGQAVVNVSTWGLLMYWIAKTAVATRLPLMICVIYATAGEIFLSLGWGLYDYRLGNIPLFVPPGHALLFALGVLLAARLPDWIMWAVPAAVAPMIIALAWLGTDMLGPPLYTLLVISMIFNRARKLYAVMFMLALAMEIYGTTVGNWSWHREVPLLGLATLNPPLAAGAFYCVLDMLVVGTATLLQRRLSARSAASGR